jgi:hypothetical protein
MLYNINMFFRELCFLFLFAANFYLLLFSYIGCYHNNNIKDKNLHENEIKVTQKKIKNNYTPVISNNFVFLERYMMSKKNGELCSIDDGYEVCTRPEELISSASGYVIRRDIKNSEVYALTADHWCRREIFPEEYADSELIPREPFLENFAHTFEGFAKVKILARDSFADICLIKFKSEYARRYKNVKISKKPPEIGELLYVQSAPHGIYGKEIRINFSGRYSGCTKMFCFFTIPAAEGSSGSSVINSRGEIVSIITAVIVDFESISIGPTLEQLHNFMEKNNEKIRH